jgi:uncharacterized protein (DUF1778 family)
MAEQPERLDLRLSPEHKRLIERAAAAKGHSSVSGFAVVELIEIARAIVEESEVLTLSSRDWDRFAEVLDQNEPNEALASAAKSYRAKHTR